jgi:hypothetical protein
MKIRDILWSWDFISSFILAIICYLVLPCKINSEILREVYSVGITVLSIIFSIYFAASAIIITSSVDDFILFLEETNLYTNLIAFFKYTLVTLFIGLIYSIIVFLVTVYLEKISNTVHLQNKILVTIFVFLFFYSLFTTIITTKDAIKFAEYRSKFLTGRNNNKPSNNSN